MKICTRSAALFAMSLGVGATTTSCGSMPTSPVEPSTATASPSEARANGEKQTVYIYSYDISGHYPVGQPVTFISSAPDQTVLTKKPFGDAVAWIPSGDLTFRVTVVRDGFCPIDRTFDASAPREERWIRLDPGCH
jgi:hypothetical protein